MLATLLTFIKKILEKNTIQKLGVGHDQDIKSLFKNSKIRPDSCNMVDI
jgi:hypothetical protein